MGAGSHGRADRNWWRYPDEHSRGYLTQLAAWGYPLSHVEQLAAGIQPDTDQPDTDAADAEPEDGEDTPTRHRFMSHRAVWVCVGYVPAAP